VNRNELSLRVLASWGAEFVQVAERGKFPLGVGWPNTGTSDVDGVMRWIDAGYNVGLLLGCGNLIDVEYDDDAGRACLRSLGLLGAKTPTWASGRGEHRLFRLGGALPPFGWRRSHGMEVRLGGKPAQSVLPPSRHPRGGVYEWLVPPMRCEPMEVALSDLGIMEA
jgi:hypothetical protein